MLAQIEVETPCGTMFAVASENGVRSIYSLKQEIPAPPSGSKMEKILHHLAQEMSEYFQGQRHSFEVPLDAVGTDFQKKVWQELRRIPYGKTISYRQLALNIGNVNASRAVGGANGKNPLWIVVPCHRVIASTGDLGGYAGGLPMKSFLLTHENVSSLKSATSGS